MDRNLGGLGNDSNLTCMRFNIFMTFLPLSFFIGQAQSRCRRVGEDRAGQGRGRSRAGTGKHLPIRMTGVVGMDGLDWVFLKASQGLMETVAALAVDAVAVLAVAEVCHMFGDVNNM